MLVTEARYRAITGDTTTAASAVSALIEEATELLEGKLGRPLAEAERTEHLYADRDGWVHPRATPILEAEGWTIDGDDLRAGPGWARPWWGLGVDALEVTYTGGFVERTANPNASNRLPKCIERDIARVAHALTTATAVASQYPAHAVNVRLGDAGVTFGTSGAPTAEELVDDLWSAQTLAYTYRPLTVV